MENTKKTLKEIFRVDDMIFAEHFTARILKEDEGLTVDCFSCGERRKVENEKELEIYIEAHNKEHEYFNTFIEEYKNKLEEELKELLKNFDIEVKGTVTVNDVYVYVGTRFYEISDTVAENFECEEEDEEKCEEEFWEVYKVELENLNEEHAIEIEGKINLGFAVIEIQPKYVESDYDIAGAFFAIHFAPLGLVLTRNASELASYVAQLVGALVLAAR